MQGTISLNALPHGRAGRVASLSSGGGMRRRLQDIGLIEGTRVKRVQSSPLGDPVAYQIRGAVVALRGEDAATVFVRME